MEPLRKTLATRAVVEILLREPATEIHAYRICQTTSQATGIVVPILRRMEEAGMVTSRWDDTTKPRRRYYRLTATGWGYLTRWLADIPKGVPL